MGNQTIVQLAQDLEWLGCELEYFGHKHAMEGFPGSGDEWDSFLEKQRGVLATADKIDRELKGAVRFNPTSLVGVDFPIDAALESVGNLLAAVEEIKQSAVFEVHALPPQVRKFCRLVTEQFGAPAAASR